MQVGVQALLLMAGSPREAPAQGPQIIRASQAQGTNACLSHFPAQRPPRAASSYGTKCACLPQPHAGSCPSLASTSRPGDRLSPAASLAKPGSRGQPAPSSHGKHSQVLETFPILYPHGGWHLHPNAGEPQIGLHSWPSSPHSTPSDSLHPLLHTHK